MNVKEKLESALNSGNLELIEMNQTLIKQGKNINQRLDAIEMELKHPGSWSDQSNLPADLSPSEKRRIGRKLNEATR